MSTRPRTPTPLLMMILAGPAVAGGGEQPSIQQVLQVPLQAGPVSESLILPQFDPAQGRLFAMDVRLEIDNQVQIQLENTGAAPASIGWSFDTQAELSGPGLLFLQSTTAIADTAELAAFDGTSDFGGASGFANLDALSDDVVSMQIDNAQLRQFVGLGDVTLDFQAMLGATDLSGVSDLTVDSTAQVAATITVRYFYAPNLLDLSHTVDVPNIELGVPTTITLPRFPPELGTKLNDRIVVCAFARGDALVENLDTTAVTATGANWITFELSDGSDIDVQGDGFRPFERELAAFDGTIDGSGASGSLVGVHSVACVSTNLGNLTSLEGDSGGIPGTQTLELLANAFLDIDAGFTLDVTENLIVHMEITLTQEYIPSSDLQTLEYEVQGPATSIPWTGQDAELPQFDPQLGTLIGASIRPLFLGQGTFSVENTSSFTHSQSMYEYGAQAFVDNPNGLPIQIIFGTASGFQSLAPFDGTLDFQGPSAATLNGFGNGRSQFVSFYNNGGDLLPFLGTGTTTWSSTSVTDSTAYDAGVVTQTDLTGEMRYRVRYTYRPASGSFCFGNGGVHPGCTDCPCDNNAQEGTPGGCLNSVGTSCRLTSTGSASLSAETLEFDIRDAAPNTFAILNSGGNRLANPGGPCAGLGSGVIGTLLDGLRCIGGGTLRHGVRPTTSTGTNLGAWSGVLNNANFTAGQVRHFQIFYRDDEALGCMTGLNTSNGLTVQVAP